MISFALVGCGNIGQRHAEIMAKMGRIVGVVDVDTYKADKMAAIYGVNRFVSLENIYQSGIVPDVVAVCTPSGLHANQSITAMIAGSHVICEKPMAILSKDAVKMIKVSETENRHLFIVKQNRYNPPIVALQQILQSGKLGKILSVQVNCYWNRSDEYYNNGWRGKKELAGGTLFTQFSHFIDLLIWLFGEAKVVYTKYNNAMHTRVSELDDQGMVALEWDNGSFGNINYTLNAYNKNMEGSITVFGEKGTVKVGGQYLNVLEYQEIKDYVISSVPKGNTANNYGFYEGSMSNHSKVYENVMEVLAGRQTIDINGVDGLKTVELIEKIYEHSSDFQPPFTDLNR